MTRHDAALEQMRSANPIPGVGHLDADELVLSRSHFEERRLAMTTSTPTPRDLVSSRQPRLRPVLVAAAAFALVIAAFGVGTVLLRGGEVPVADEPETTIASVTTTAPQATTVPEEPAPVAPEEPSMEAGVRVLSEEPEYGANLVIGHDGLPMLLSTTRFGDEYPGTARLFRCADVACDEFAVETLEPVSDSDAVLISGGTNEALVAAPDGSLYMTLESPGAVHTVGRYAGGVIEQLPTMFNWPGNEELAYMPLPAAFDDTGNPVFLGYHGMHSATVSLAICSDPVCSDYAEIELDRGILHNQFPGASFDGDVARAVYAIGEPTGPPSPEAGYDGAEAVWHTKVATITDLHGSAQVSTETIYEGLNAYMIDAAFAASGNPVVRIWQWEETGVPGEPSQSIVTVSCGNQQCTETAATENQFNEPAMIGEFDAQMRPIAGYVETIYDPDDWAAYLAEEQRIADEGLEDVGVMEPEPIGANIVVAQCSDTVCSSVERTTIATTETDWWHADSFEIEVTPDGSILVAVAGSETSPAPGLRLFVFPGGDLGPGVDPIEGHAVVGWPAR